MRNRDMSGAVFVVAVLLALFAVGVAQGSIGYSRSLFPDGSSAAPSIAFAAEPDLGLYRIGTDTIGMDANLRMFATTTVGVSLIGSESVVLGSGAKMCWTAGTPANACDTTIGRVSAGIVGLTATTFAALGTPANGSIGYCSDCTFANPCAGSGSGAIAKRLNGAWRCD